MIFSIAIYAPPYSQTAETAYRFALSVCQQDHSLYRVFFYGDGVYQGSELLNPPQGDWSIGEAWKTLSQEYEVDLVLCIAASLKRGIFNPEEADRYEKDQHNMAKAFELSGLGQLADATLVSDRIVTFGCQ